MNLKKWLLFFLAVLMVLSPLQAFADPAEGTEPEEGDISIGIPSTPPVTNSYTVVFKDADGTVISSAAYAYGDEVEVPEAPVKEADAVGSYSFAGWDKPVTACTGNATYKATYDITYKDYTITFQYEDGDVIETQTLHWGDVVTAPAAPTKAEDDTYTYTFAGWDKDVVAVSGNATYTATFTPSYKEYTITFLNNSGSVIEIQNLHWGDAITPPAREDYELAGCRYTFTGWAPAIVPVAGDAQYTAAYDVDYIDYTITFQYEDGSVIETQTLHYGDTVTAPAAPTKAEDDNYTYTFIGWDKEVVAVAGDATYTAVFQAVAKDPDPVTRYTVIFQDEDGTVLSSTQYEAGQEVIEPAAPTKAADNTYTYTFNGWDKEVITVATGDATYTATYMAEYIDYTITFVGMSGIIETQTLHWGDQINPPIAVNEEDDDYYYYFADWDKELVPVAGDATYTAVYDREPKKDGWEQEGGIWYFYDNGVKLTNSWMNDSTGGWCYLTETGAMATDTFVQDTKGWAYVDSRGYWKQGTYWQLVDGTWYYLENGYQVRNAWKKDSTGWCWLTDTGAMATNAFVKDSTGWAYVDASGYWKQTTGWLWLDGKWYYLEGGYSVRNQWRKDSVGWCWLTDTGAMATNAFVKDSTGWAYVDASGYWKQITDWLWLDGEWYYLEGGYQVRNQWRKDSTGWCYLTEDGSMMTSSWLKDSVGWCYIDENGYCLAGGTYTVDGHEYTFDADGRIEGEPIGLQ